MSADLKQARVEAVLEVSGAMLLAASAAMDRHGDDPECASILLAAIAMLADKIDRGLSRGFSNRLVKMLEDA